MGLVRDEPCVIDGHLSHYCTIDAVIVLRCAPDTLRQRLKQRVGYGHEKIESNVEWELIAGIWSDLLNLHPDASVLELDTTNQSIDLERVLQYIANGDADGFVRDAIHRARLDECLICCRKHMTLLPLVGLIQMALEQLRKRWESIASPLVSGLGRTNPAVLTWLALPIGVAASFLAFTAPKSDTGALMLIGAALLITFSMILDGLDGQLARQTGQVTLGRLP